MLFKKIELWVLILIFLVFIIFTIIFGALLRDYYLGGNRFPKIQKVATFVASIPSNIAKYKILTKGDTPPVLFKNKNKKKFVRFEENLNEKLLILPRYDGNLNRSVVEIINLNDFKVLHTYQHNIDELNQSITNTIEHKNIKIDQSKSRFVYLHPLILNDGSLISSHEYGPLFRIDFCSNILWINQDENFHHSKEFAIDRDYFWVPIKTYPHSKYINEKNLNEFSDDAVAKVDISGNIIFTKSVSELLIENNILYENDLFEEIDPIHLNDIQPVFETSNFMEKGDIFLSLRHQNSIVHYRPSNNTVINYIKGPFYVQHDVDIISGNEISIFNNNDNILENSKYSEILLYNLETKKFKKKFNNSLVENNFKTKTQGISQILKDGSMLVEEQNHGRLIFFNKKGDKEWEFVNKDNNGNIYLLSWSRIIEDKKEIEKIKNIISNRKCQK